LRCYGGARRNRTDDLFNAIEALSQLSYGPQLLSDLGLAGALFHMTQEVELRKPLMHSRMPVLNRYRLRMQYAFRSCDDISVARRWLKTA
jgi:hypothetical protein